ncbi:MAG: hypothetical protein K8T90_19690 [Planctomycetes bacterium]|nr:hypothetical protein [Planctomycetota bacterium]
MDTLQNNRSASPFDSAWNLFRGTLRGPVGCLIMLLCLPFALLAFLILIVVALWKGRQFKKAIQGQLDAERATSDAVPCALYVQTFAADPSFSREEATQAAVPADAGKTATELLDDALRRGWIAERGGMLAVTDKGREQIASVLRARGL